METRSRGGVEVLIQEHIKLIQEHEAYPRAYKAYPRV